MMRSCRRQCAPSFGDCHDLLHGRYRWNGWCAQCSWQSPSFVDSASMRRRSTRSRAFLRTSSECAAIARHRRIRPLVRCSSLCALDLDFEFGPDPHSCYGRCHVDDFRGTIGVWHHSNPAAIDCAVRSDASPATLISCTSTAFRNSCAWNSTGRIFLCHYRWALVAAPCQRSIR